MIKFFRHIRQKLLSENKFSRYLLYAIGEIVLVVIGILIALQINNWNENRKSFLSEQTLYKKLIIDLKAEEQNTKTEIQYLKRHQDLHYYIYNQTAGKPKNDSIMSYNRLQWIIIYHPKIEENYAGIIEKISNDSIRDLVSQYILTEKVTKDANKEFNAYKLEHLRPYFSRNGILNTESAFNETPYDFMSLDNVELINRKKLEEQYGSNELDQILFNLRFKTSWQIHNNNKLLQDNINLRKVLNKAIL